MRDSCGTGGQSEKWKWLVQPRQAKGERQGRRTLPFWPFNF
ncbi:hypothetical protein QUF49_11275 [Fictibacillus sp. b24]|nr:hypothetical protein [Fictibacillus sp. b24]MDM5316576.1 hypothetical protein [Fictibacillus sp. b24]